MSLTTLKLKDITVDRSLNPRLELDKETVEQYIETFAQLPPPVVYETDRGNLLTDGFHRLQAARGLGLGEIAVELRRGSYIEAAEHAALANVRHGRPLNRAERRKVIELLLTLHHGAKSDREIGELAGVDGTTVSRTHARLVAEGRLLHCSSCLTCSTGNHRKAEPATLSESVLAPEPPPPPPDPWPNVVCGDAFEVLPHLEPDAYDLIFVDPPYGILDGQEWEPQTLKELLGFTRKWLGLVVPMLKPTGRLFICFSQWYMPYLRLLMRRYERAYGLVYSNTIIWNYRNVVNKPTNRAEFKLTYEPILYYRGPRAAPLNWSVYGADEQTDVWPFAVPQSNFEDTKTHPAQKPLALLERIIALCCPTDGIVLDPFAGSGTTGHAALRLARSFRLIERDPQYVCNAKERLTAALAATKATNEQ